VKLWLTELGVSLLLLTVQVTVVVPMAKVEPEASVQVATGTYPRVAPNGVPAIWLPSRLRSALYAFAPTKELLIMFRVFQGIGGGALMPVAFAVIYREFPPTERAMVTAVVGIPLLGAPAFGPTLGGYLSSTFDWNAIFTINIKSEPEPKCEQSARIMSSDGTPSGQCGS